MHIKQQADAQENIDVKGDILHQHSVAAYKNALSNQLMIINKNIGILHISWT